MENLSANEPLLICHECDLLQKSAELKPGDKLVCPRCEAVLSSRPRANLDHALAYALAAAICLVIANIYPIMTLEFQGLKTEVTMVGSAQMMYENGKVIVSLLVMVTALIAPAITLLSTLYMLVPLKLDKIPAGFFVLFRMMRWALPWTMIEVLMLGILVTLVKLSSVAITGVSFGLWAFAMSMVLMALLSGVISDRELWMHYERITAQNNQEDLA